MPRGEAETEGRRMNDPDRTAVRLASELLDDGGPLSPEDRRTLTLAVTLGAPTSRAARTRIYRLDLWSELSGRKPEKPCPPDPSDEDEAA